MTRDVLISISGNHLASEESDYVELITAGDYFEKNGTHYILYNEVLDGGEEMIKNTIKIHPDKLDIIKKGSTNVRMTFEKDKKNLSCYMTPYGEMIVGVHTDYIEIKEKEHSLKVQLNYRLDINYEQVSQCHMTLDVQSKSMAQINLQSK